MDNSCIKEKYPTYSKISYIIESDITRLSYVSLNELYLALAESANLKEKHWEEAKQGNFDEESFRAHEINYNIIVMSLLTNMNFSYSKAELYAALFIVEFPKKSKDELSISLKYMEYILDEVKKYVSHSAIELLLLETISICKEELNKKE